MRGADDAHVDAAPRPCAHRRTARSWITRSSLLCIDSGSSPISSRNSVPPAAAWKKPSRSSWAPVKRPSVAEEFGFEQGPEWPAVDRDERLHAARRHFMDGPRHQFLAGADSPVTSTGYHAARHLLDRPASHRPPGRSALATPRRSKGLVAPDGHRRSRTAVQAGGAVHPARVPRRGPGRRRHLAPRSAQRRSHHAAELAQVDRLGQVVVGARPSALPPRSRPSRRR